MVYEGKPITPNAGKIWEMIERYKSKTLFLAPTAVRILKKTDYDGAYIKQHDLKSLELVSVLGERCDPSTIRWLHERLPNSLIMDNWWQTESGWPIAAKMCNRKTFGPVIPTLPGSCGRLVPGYDLRVLDDDGNEVGPNELGNIVVKQPLPPSFMQTLWRNDQGFIEKYLTEFPGYYDTSDSGFIDDKGYVHIMTRTDDVIKPAGHRVSTGSLEEAINEVNGVVESATVGFIEEIRGEIPLAFIVLKDEIMNDKNRQEIIKDQVSKKVRTNVGDFAKLHGVIIVGRLPKTRSGKILRGTIKKIVNGQPYTVPATIEDQAALDEIKQATQDFLKL